MCIYIYKYNIIYSHQHTISIVKPMIKIPIVVEPNSPHIPTIETWDSPFVPSTLIFKIFSKLNL